MGGGGKGGGKFEVNDYYMSMHVGVCLGAVDITGIFVGDKTAWTGNAVSDQDISISQRNLFGGNKKEGGLEGTVRLMRGTAVSMVANLAARLGRTVDTCPAFRGFTSLFFVGSTGDTSSGFLWSSNSPYLKDLSVRARRRANTFTAGPGEPSNYSDMGDGGKTCNPAHMIYECLTDPEWGMGGSPAAIDVASFRLAAKTLYQEGLGLAMIWTQQAKIESFINEIIDHIQATFYLNPYTGLLTIKLLRDDYDTDLLPELTPDNCVVKKFQRKTWGETINEITVSWTNPDNEEDSTVTIHDLANIEMQGGIVSETRDYYGIRTGELAMKIAARDIRSAAAPLATFDIVIDRTLTGILPGNVVKLTYPEYGINGLVLRLGKCDYGKPGDPSIKVTALEDVFGLPQSAYAAPADTEWDGGSQDPTALDYTAIMTLPAYFAARFLATISGTIPEYPEVITGVLGATANLDTRSFELWTELVQPNGSIEMTNVGTKGLTSRSTLQINLTPEVTTVLSGSQLGIQYATIGALPTDSGFVIIGDANSDSFEIALIDSVSSGYGAITLKRGVFDTVPKSWPNGTPVWYVSDAVSWAGNTRFADTDVGLFKATPSTSRGTLPLGSAPLLSHTMNGRPHYPLRPGNVKVNGNGFGPVFDRTGSDVAVTWANRNRLTEDTQVVVWDEGDITPETGQTTTITVMDMDRNTIIDHTGLTGTSFSLPIAPFSSESAVIIRVTAERDGFESLQGHEIILSFGSGFGTDYGNNYGAT